LQATHIEGGEKTQVGSQQKNEEAKQVSMEKGLKAEEQGERGARGSSVRGLCARGLERRRGSCRPFANQ